MNEGFHWSSARQVLISFLFYLPGVQRIQYVHTRDPDNLRFSFLLLLFTVLLSFSVYLHSLGFSHLVAPLDLFFFRHTCPEGVLLHLLLSELFRPREPKQILQGTDVPLIIHFICPPLHGSGSFATNRHGSEVYVTFYPRWISISSQMWYP